MDERWKPVRAARGYEVSDHGRVRNVRRGTILGGTTTANGYVQVRLSGAGGRRLHYVHRLVAAAFHGLPTPGQVVNHLNAVRNDNRAENLRWCSPLENARHAAANGRLRPGRMPGERNPRAKLDLGKVLDIRARSARGESLSGMAREYGLSRSAVYKAAVGQTWALAG